jgi:hypothetical protein
MALFETGAQFPPVEEVERLALYKAMEAFYEAKQDDIYNRLQDFLKDRPQRDQISKLYLGCNLADVICTKPSELLLSEPPIIDSGKDVNTEEQKAVDRIEKANNIRNLIFRMTVTGAIHGDSFLKVYFNYRQDFTELFKMQRSLGIEPMIPDTVKPEIVMQSLSPEMVFPELAKGSKKDFKAVNIANIEWVQIGKDEIPYLVVERHIPFYVQYKRYELKLDYVNDLYYDVSVPVYTIGDEVGTGREENLVYTGVEKPLVFHFPYKQTDLDWRGTGAIEKIAEYLVAIADRLTAIDWILHKHSDPILVGPHIEGNSALLNLSGAYMERSNEDPDLKYVTWEPHLQYNFQELDMLLNNVFLMAQLPSWLFGSSITNANVSGGGTSHTDSSTTKLRYAPVSALLDRLNSSLVEVLGDAFYYAQVLENEVNKTDNGYVKGFIAYTPVRPRIQLSTGIPRNDKEVVENTVLRYQNGLIDKVSALKTLDGLDDVTAEDMAKKIREDEISQTGTVDSTIFNNQGA